MGNEPDGLPDNPGDLIDAIGGKAKKGRSAGNGNSDVTPAQPESPAPSKSPAGAGDFSLLMKKLGMAGKGTPPPSPQDSPALPDPDPESPTVTSLEDLLEDEPVAREAFGEAQPAHADMEIVDESPSESLKKNPSWIQASVSQEPGETKSPVATGPPPEEKIISVDQISDLSGLILPRSATFHVDELKLHSRLSAFDSQGIGTLPDEFDEIWKKELSKVGFRDLDLGDVTFGEVEIARPSVKKFSLSGLFAAIRTEEEEYDAKKHGPLVDLAFIPRAGIEEMEMYPVNEPYAYVRIVYDHTTHEYTYHVLEPVLADPEKDLLKELKERLFETLDINTKDLSREDARQKLRAATNDILQDYGIRLTPVQKEKIHYNMNKDFLGDGLIDPIMHDKYIEDISCDGVHTPIFAFHSSYESMKTTLAYHTSEDLDSFVTKLAQRAGKYISIAEPILDATMQDGSRIQMTLGTEVTAHGSTFTIRKFKDEPITPTDLIEWHTFAPLSIAYIWLAVENGKSAIFAGGTASGKTTALNAISLFIPPMAKIVSLEDTRELKLPHPNWIPSVTRDSFDTAGRGEINMYELLRAAMRQRPEYIIVGEVRGKECQTLFQAMSTGHVTYSTTHADSVASVVHRIENPPMDVPRNMLSALDFICVQVQARVGGKRIRRNKQIVEILDIDPRTNELITNEVFKWRSATDEHTYSGKSYLLEEIMEAKGWSEERMREELKRRQEVLEWMRIKKIRHYKDVAKTLISYHRDPEAVIEKVRKDLYE
ncbi:MAG TPA: ATPase, T2SS/T4P/T4SS family [Methanoregula sp.]|nr:ATPase, T2SS/T4P/T4SS family [Methanoregula sp.]